MSSAEEATDEKPTPSVEAGPAHEGEALVQAADVPMQPQMADSAPVSAAPLGCEEAAHRADTADDFASGLAKLPPYCRSLLKVDVPISVVLASKRQRLADILRLVPGSIIQFSKLCEDVLELRAAGQTVAVGEAVKVGDFFGLRITSMILPDERFQRVGHDQRSGPRAVGGVS